MERVIAPLRNFEWSGEIYSLAKNIQIEPFSKPFDFSPWHDLLSRHDIEIGMALNSHILSVPAQGAFGHSYMDVIHLFLFCLWIATYNRTNVRYVLHSSGRTATARRICGYYRYVESRGKTQIQMVDLDKTGILLPIAAQIYGKRHRLATALYFTHVMKTQDKWVPSFLAGVSAIEALFSKNTPGGQTFAVSRRVGAFLRNDKASQVTVARKMLRLYDRRSRLVHGRYVLSIGDEKSASVHLGWLYETEDLLRKSWWKILKDTTHRRIFRNNRQRDSYLSNLASHISKNDTDPNFKIRGEP